MMLLHLDCRALVNNEICFFSIDFIQIQALSHQLSPTMMPEIRITYISHVEL